MAFTVNFWYEPEKNKKDFVEGNLVEWKTFKDADKKYIVVVENSCLELRKKMGKKKESIILSQALVMNPDEKHMILISSDDKEISVYVDNKVIKKENIEKKK